MSDGVKVSLPGYDVHDATPEQCSIHTDYLSPKIDLQATPQHFGTVNILFNNDPADGSTNTLYSFAHGYDHTPAVIGFGTYVNGVSDVEGTLPFTLSLTFNLYLEATTTHINLKLEYYTGWGTIIGDSITVTFYVFAENGA